MFTPYIKQNEQRELPLPNPEALVACQVCGREFYVDEKLEVMLCDLCADWLLEFTSDDKAGSV
jgi:hypothetical protein